MIDPSPLSDLRLSLKARGLYALFLASGRVIPPSELEPLVPEGREAIRSALAELISHGYIRRTKYRSSNGQYVHQYEINTVTTYGFPVDGEPVPLYSGTAVSDIANSFQVLAVFPNGNTSNTARLRVRGENDEEYVEMPWPGFEDTDQPQKPRGVADDDAVGSVGKLVDKVAARNAKYKKTKFEAVPQHMRRGERPEDQWTTADLVAEFYDLTREHAPGIPSQVNGAGLAKWLNQQVGQGIPRLSLLKALRAFFNDPRNLRDLGVGKPLWRRFLAFYPTVHGLYSGDGPVDYDDPGLDEHSAKMAKLLED